MSYIAENHITNEIFTPVIAVTETWLKPHVTDAQIHLPKYQTLRADRKLRNRGGALLYIHEDLPVSNESSYDEYYCQAVMCTIKPSNTILASVYRPPDTTEESTISLLSFITSYIHKAAAEHHMDIIIAGDINLPGINWHDLTVRRDTHTNSAHSLLSFMSDHLLSQYVNVPTRNHNILDLLLTNNSNLTLHVSAEETKLSDHKIVSVLTKQSFRQLPTKNKQSFINHTFRNLRIQKSSLDPISEHIKSVDWDQLRSNCSEQEFPELMRLTILQICELHCDTKSHKGSKPRNKFVRERRTLNRKRRKINNLLLTARNKPANPQTVDRIEKKLTDVVNQIKDSIKNQQDDDEKRAVNTVTTNPSFFFSYAKRFAKHTTTTGPLLDGDGNLQQDPHKMADMLQDQYSSVFSEPSDQTAYPTDDSHHTPESSPILDDIIFTQNDIISAIKQMGEHSASAEDDIPSFLIKNCPEAISYPILIIWRDSLKSGIIPQAFKNQIITPVFKKGSKAIPANYRPISLTSNIIKIFERIIRDHLVQHLELNKILCKHQHGFRKCRSCLTQLLKHIDTILNNFLNGQDTDSIYLDFAKAFDKVDHKILINKLHSYGIRGNLLSWLKNYLDNRSQTVVINGVHSYPANVRSGVPQGTVLGPILFLIYINDLNKCINHSLISHFADDTRILKAIATSADVSLLQDDLLETEAWSKKNKMILHEDKYELLSHTTSKSNYLQHLPFSNQFFQYTTTGGLPITPCEMVRDLGVHITPDLNWSPHINLIADKGRQLISWVLSVFHNRSEEIMMCLYKSLIRSRLEYASPLWNPYKQEDIKTLESVQRQFTSRIEGLSDLSYYERLQALKILSLQRRRERFIIIMVWKIINGETANDLNLETTNAARRGVKVKVPPLKMTATQRSRSLYEHSFAVVGPKLWNTLPSKISKITVKSTFKTSLSRYLSQIPDRPPIDGFTSHNSLLEINRLQFLGGQTPGATSTDAATTAASTVVATMDDPDGLRR